MLLKSDGPLAVDFLMFLKILVGLINFYKIARLIKLNIFQIRWATY